MTPEEIKLEKRLELERLVPEYAHHLDQLKQWMKSPEPVQIDSKELYKILQALAEARKAQEWRDISEAPKDGSDVILALINAAGNVESPALAYWNDKDLRTDHYQAGWYESTFSDFTYRIAYTPIKWRPVPTPPSVQEGV